jgi:predicted GNAT family acetyltransferase
MRLARFEGAAEFMAQAGLFLMEHEDEHNLMLGLCATLQRQPEVYAEGAYLAVVMEGDAIVTAALRTPPYNLVLARVADGTDTAAAHALLASDARACYGTLPGASGPAALTRSFAEVWHALTGEPYQRVLHEYLYRLDRLVPPSAVPGQLRRASEADHPLLEEWIVAFNDEALGGVEHMNPARWVTNALSFDTRGLYLWEDDVVVAMAGWSGPTAHGIRIGPVYTPPDQRRRGYAGACVGALSQLLLDEGRDFCVLYTDASNPTSNHVYQMLGYQRIMEADVYTFGA